MNYKDYSTLKTANKVSLKKEGNDVILEEKRYSSETGEELNSFKSRIHLKGLESDKLNYLTEKEALELKIAEMDKMIVDIQAL